MKKSVLSIFFILTTVVLHAGAQGAWPEQASGQARPQAQSQAQAQAQPPEPETVIGPDIAAVRVTARRPLSAIGVQRSTIDTALLHDNVAASLADVLAYGTSLFVKSYGRATLSTVSLRGTSPSHTQVTWNGMLINSPMLGMVDFSTLPSYFTDEVSVYHGASSTAIAGGGLGGAITLSTRPAPDKGLGVRYVQGVGSYGTWDEFAHVTWGGDRWQFSTRASMASSDNDFRYTNRHIWHYSYDEDNRITGRERPAMRNANGSFRDLNILQEAYYTADGGDKWSAAAWYTGSRRGVPSLSVSYRDQDLSRDEQREETLRATLSWERGSPRHRLRAAGGYSYSDLLYTSLSDNADAVNEKIHSRSYLHTATLSLAADLFLSEKWHLNANLSGQQHFVKSIDRALAPADRQRVVVGYDQARLEISAYAALRYRPTERLGLAASLREDVYGGRATTPAPALFAEYLLSRRGNLLLKASAARNYRHPSLNDLYFMPGGNPDLRPEKGFAWDAGTEFTVESRRLSLHGELTAFDARIRDWILWVRDRKLMSPINVRKVHSYGFEAKARLSLKLSPAASLSLDGNFALTHSVNDGQRVNDRDMSTGKQLPYIPLRSAAAVGRLQWRQWTLGWKWNHYSERFTTTSNAPTALGRVGPYYMNDLWIEKRFAPQWARITLRLNANNLFDEEYESVLMRPMAGRNYGFSLEISPRPG